MASPYYKVRERGVYLFDVDANRTIAFIATKQNKNRVNGSKI